MVCGGWKKRQGDGKQKYSKILAKVLASCNFVIVVQKYTLVPIRKIMRTISVCHYENPAS